jgi:GNAT superfamily N-acetyltransferase
VQALHVQGNASFFRATTIEQVAAWFKERLESKDAYAWVGEDEGVAVAYALVMTQERPATPFTTAVLRYEVDQIGVLPDARRRGHARRLLEHVCTHAREAGASEVILKSWAFNSGAHAAFERLGFEAQVVQLARSLRAAGETRPDARPHTDVSAPTGHSKGGA